jgi:5'-3' exonuclease
MQIHLIDGTYELYRSFYGAPSATAPDGQEVGGTRGLLRSLAALLRQADCTHIAIAFDHVIESFRNDLFDGYKTGDGIDPELHAQFPLAEAAAEALGITVWPMVDFEADDAIATGAARWSAASSVDRVLICSPDKDFAQCVEGDRIVLWDRMRDKIINEAGVAEKWGVSPGSIPDLLALMGDSADGIPGIPRWGQKSSATLLAEYRHIEAIPSDCADWSVPVRGAAGLSNQLEENREEALLYKRLATLRRDVPLEEKLVDLRWRGARRKKLEALAASIGDTRLMDRITEWRSDED